MASQQITPSKLDLGGSTLGGRLVTFQFTAGTSGAAPTTMTYGGNYLNDTPITKSTNDYIFNLNTNWFRVIPIDVTVRQASFSTAGANEGHITSDSINDSTPTFTVSFYNGAGTAVALATGDVVIVTAMLTNENPNPGL